MGRHTQGQGAKTQNEGEVTLGRWNALGSAIIFSIGCGTDGNNRENALEVDADGKVSFPAQGVSVQTLLDEIAALKQRVAALEGNS